MNLYMLSCVLQGWDEYDSFAIIAPSEEMARMILRAELESNGNAWQADYEWECERVYLHRPGVIMSSFNAG